MSNWCWKFWAGTLFFCFYSFAGLPLQCAKTAKILAEHYEERGLRDLYFIVDTEKKVEKVLGALKKTEVEIAKKDNADPRLQRIRRVISEIEKERTKFNNYWTFMDQDGAAQQVWLKEALSEKQWQDLEVIKKNGGYIELRFDALGFPNVVSGSADALLAFGKTLVNEFPGLQTAYINFDHGVPPGDGARGEWSFLAQFNRIQISGNKHLPEYLNKGFFSSRCDMSKLADLVLENGSDIHMTAKGIWKGLKTANIQKLIIYDVDPKTLTALNTSSFQADLRVLWLNNAGSSHSGSKIADALSKLDLPKLKRISFGGLFTGITEKEMGVFTDSEVFAQLEQLQFWVDLPRQVAYQLILDAVAKRPNSRLKWISMGYKYKSDDTGMRPSEFQSKMLKLKPGIEFGLW